MKHQLAHLRSRPVSDTVNLNLLPLQNADLKTTPRGGRLLLEQSVPRCVIDFGSMHRLLNQPRITFFLIFFSLTFFSYHMSCTPEVFRNFFKDHAEVFIDAPDMHGGEHNLEYHNLFQVYLALYEVSYLFFLNAGEPWFVSSPLLLSSSSFSLPLLSSSLLFSSPLLLLVTGHQLHWSKRSL